MAQAPIGDRLVRALASIDELQETVGKHDEILTKLVDLISEMNQRLAIIGKAANS